MQIGVHLTVKFRAFRITVATVNVCKRILIEGGRIEAVYDEDCSALPRSAWTLFKGSGVELRVWPAG